MCVCVYIYNVCNKLDEGRAPLAPAGDWGRKRSDREEEGRKWDCLNFLWWGDLFLGEGDLFFLGFKLDQSDCEL